MSLVDGNADSSKRIIYVGNVPHEAAEENLRELLLQYGDILNFRLFKDALSQYAYCEYEENEMADRAIHRLSNYAIAGQVLRADIAAGNRSAEELLSLKEFVSAGSLDLPQAMDVSEKAPEEISKAVASLPAEQMFELMKQMKMCIENNPQEARNLLLQNPQLAYALLQAQVIMRIVDPEVALQILDRPPPIVAEPEAKSVDVKQTLPAVSMAASFASDKDMRQLTPPDFEMRPQPLDKDMRQVSGDMNLRASGPADNRPFDPRFRPADSRAVDPRSMQGSDPRSMQGMDPRAMQRNDPRGIQAPDPRAMQGDPRISDPGMMQGVDPRMMPGSDPRSMLVGDPRGGPGMDPRGGPGMDPRAMQQGPGFGPQSAGNVDPRSIDPRKPPNARPPTMALPSSEIPEDEEKAALIMQVLQLSEEQIAMLPPEQRQSIMVLKEQIARSQLL